MDLRFYHDTMCENLSDKGMDIPYSRFDRDSNCPSEIKAVDPITGEIVKFIALKEEPNGTTAD